MNQDNKNKNHNANHNNYKIPGREIRKDLENIYEDDDGNLPDISRLEPRKKKGVLQFLTKLAVILLILAGIAWAGYYVFNKYAPNQLKKVIGEGGEVELTIEAQKEMSAGDQIKYLIKYKNHKKVDLKKISLNVRYPSGLIIESSNPEADKADDGSESLVKEDNWSLGTLARGASGEVEITGKLIGAQGTNANIWAVLYYEPENFASQFQTEASFSTTIESSPFDIVVEGTKQLATTDPVELNIKYENKSEKDEELKDVLLEVIYPQGFVVEETDPKTVEGSDNQWQIVSFKKGDKGELKIKGKFSANVTGGQDFTIKASIKNQDKYLSIAENIYSVAVVSGDLLTELKINGSKDDGMIDFGQTLNYSLTYENSGKDVLKNLTATVFFTPSAEFIEWTTLVDRYDGLLDEFEAGKSISWTEKEVPNLEELRPGDKGVIDFSVKISSNAGKLSGDLSLRTVASIKTQYVNKEEMNIENRSNAITTKINSNLALVAYGQYFDVSGSSIGSGPIPPKVGQTTYYAIVWQLDNSVHEVRDVVVSTILPEKVKWGGKKDISAGDISYDPSSRKVTWKINRMPVNLDLKYKVIFDVSIAPENTDVKKILALTGDNQLSAVDQTTGSKISQAQGAITTDLTSDPLAKDKGLVVE
ncbi:MAG: hypothetical protein WC310_05120 [Patescibacteria group bacterium]|jgi:hypothetical protein